MSILNSWLWKEIEEKVEKLNKLLDYSNETPEEEENRIAQEDAEKAEWEKDEMAHGKY